MIPGWFWYLQATLFGLVIGSFLNVVIHRLPRGESIVRPASRCPGCGRPIRAPDNIPVLSWLLLRGRCRSCGMRISAVYPAVELLTAALFVLYLRRFGPTWGLIPQLALASAMIAVVFIDLEHWIIPDAITLPGMGAGLLATPLLPHTLQEGVIGLVGGGLFFYLVAEISFRILKREGIGGGDIKLAAMMGAFLGWRLLTVAIFLALLTGSAVGLALMAAGKRGRKDAIPFGPFLASGTVLAGLWGERLIGWYLGLAVA